MSKKRLLTYTNNNGVPLPMAVWLVNDTYDYISDPNYLSATQILKPTRQLILANRVPEEEKYIRDISDNANMALGNALHDAVERSWVERHAENLEKLGYPKEVIEKININPDKPSKNGIDIYTERRSFVEIDGYTIGGKFDFVAEGILHDTKSTNVYGYMAGNNDEDYIKQGSIYRLIHQDIVTKDFVRIMFFFKNWVRSQAESREDYPKSPIIYKDYPLMSIPETRAMISAKIKEIEENKDLPESEIIECSIDDLWVNEQKHRYYSNPEKTSGYGRVFKTFEEALAHKKSRGGIGIVKSDPLVPRRCNPLYCDAFSICTQKDKYDIKVD